MGFAARACTEVFEVLPLHIIVTAMKGKPVERE